jgi:hypothetical protein
LTRARRHGIIVSEVAPSTMMPMTTSPTVARCADNDCDDDDDDDDEEFQFTDKNIISHPCRWSIGPGRFRRQDSRGQGTGRNRIHTSASILPPTLFRCKSKQDHKTATPRQSFQMVANTIDNRLYSYRYLKGTIICYRDSGICFSIFKVGPSSIVASASEQKS